MEAEEELSPSLCYCQSRGCSWAQHNTAKPPWTLKKPKPYVSTSCSKHCGIAPYGKCLPKREAFPAGRRAGGWLEQEEGGLGREPGHGNATSQQPPGD